ncbi:ABC transporter permease [Clostridium grantii]|uniref:MacB-like core domain-containing protein n=1 Tax=Clostridium grantii DSM 8605 TaxID=1121316 RepID=A0A1M5WCF0_9CLOT|nr:ABC transporter permease [Clostridium grantii]SHH85130.1 MacB-like core domain-containing protein [Clostridium grantii DSM 8605]
MRLFVHGIKSLIRRPVKTLMLFTILFIVFNLVFTGFIIENSIEESKEYIRYEIGAAVEYKMDYEAAMASGERPPALSLSVAEKIAENNYVKDFFVTESVNASSEDLEPVESQESSSGFSKNASDFTLLGANSEIPIDFAMESVSLLEGSMLTEENIKNGDYVVLVSEDLATQNDLRVGDTISIEKAATNNRDNNATSSTSASTISEEFEIVGIYSALEDGYSANNLFTSLTVTNIFNDKVGSDETSASIVYLLDDPMEVELFKEKVSPLLTSEYHTLYSNDDTYESLTSPLNLISIIAKILIWVVFIAGAAIILAIVTIFVRDRKFEIGLLLSSGEGKGKIISQFIFEMLVIAIVAFGISVGTSNLASKSVSTWIVEEQLTSDTGLASSTSTASNSIMNRGPGSSRSSTSVYGDVSMDTVADEFDVSISVAVMGNLLVVSMVLVLIGSTIPLTVIMSYNPKRILQD